MAGCDVRLPCGSTSSFRARVLWPCSAEGSYPALPYMGAGVDGRAQADSLAGLVRLPSLLTAHLAGAGSGVRLGAPPLPGRQWPVLCYSHGYGGNAQMGTLVLREIASYGVVVVAVEHTDGTASRTVRADGSVQRFGERPQGGRAAGLALRRG